MDALYRRQIIINLFFICFAPKERAQVVLPEKELNELLDDSPNIFKKSNINWHIDWANTLFSGGKFSALENIWCAEFSANNVTDKTQDHSSQHQADVFQEHLFRKAIKNMTT